MGVRGLSTYLREHQRAITSKLAFSRNKARNINVVVDGWSFMYALYHDANLAWVYGGEYDDYEKLVRLVVQAWIDVGLNVYFVFDGAYPRLKYTTAKTRIGEQHIQPSLLFFRTSSNSRSTPRFLRETRIIPPLLYTATIHSLVALKAITASLDIHFADEEGDPYAVELAGRIAGYVVGNDSDFVVLNTDRYRGYIPMEEMVWSSSVVEEQPKAEDDSGFQMVLKPSRRKRPTLDLGKGLIPPEGADLVLSVTVYSPLALASHLDVPVSLLPLIGALVGNDYSDNEVNSQQSVRRLFFDRQTTPSQRITHVAGIIRTFLSTSKRNQVGSVMDLIDKTVHALLSNSPYTLGPRELENVIDRIVESTLQYAIPKYEGRIPGPEGLWASDICALHEPDTCTFLPIVSRRLTAETLTGKENEAIAKTSAIRSLYLGAYRKGDLSSRIMDVLSTGTYWPRLFLEHPDVETVSRSIGRTIRQWGYAVLDDALGLEVHVDDTVDSEQSVEEDDEDGDELIDVVEESDEDDEIGDTHGADPLAPLRGALQRLRAPDPQHSRSSRAPRSTISLSKTAETQMKIVTEYVRRGTRIADEQIAVPPLHEQRLVDLDLSSPLLLKSEGERLSFFLAVLRSDTAPLRQIPKEQLMSALTLRWVILCLHRRAEESGSHTRKSERWTKTEARCFLASFSPNSPKQIDDDPPILDRNIQLVAQTLMAMESIEHWSQILLLTKRIPSTAHAFSGKRFHAYLTGVLRVSEEVPSTLWHACEDGLDGAFAQEHPQKTKKSKHVQSMAPVVGDVDKAKKEKSTASLFSLLSDVEA